MNDMEFMHIFQPTRNASQLNSPLARLLRDQVATYKLGAVYISISLDELVDVSVFHPLGNESEPVLVQRHSKQR